MQLSGDSIKAKVVIGFGLAISVVAVAVYLFYASFTQLLGSVDDLAEPNHKLAKLQHILADIATAESSIRAFTLTTDEKYFKNYISELEGIDKQVDSLRLLMNQNPAELAQLDTIATLLDEKEKSMERYVALRKQEQKASYSDQVLRKINSSATKQPSTTIIKRHTTTTISDKTPAPEVPETKSASSGSSGRRGLFSKIFSKKNDDKEATVEEETPLAPISTPQLQVKMDVSVDTSSASAPQQVAQVTEIKSILQHLNQQVSKQEAMLTARELALLQQDKDIMDRIRTMLYNLEKSETQQASLNAESAKAVVHQNSMVLLLVGIFGLISSISFILIILRDITRSNAYKAQLIRAQKEAIQLARAKEAFVANMSHEIRTPLNVVLGFSEQLRHTPLQISQQEHLQAISSAGEHLLHIVNDVLDLSKLEAGKLQLDVVPFCLPQVLQELEQVFKLKAETKGIRFYCEADEKLPRQLLGDPLRLKQVLFNLVDNAIKFTHEGQVRVQCRLKSHRRNRVAVLLEVSDTGIGIPMDQAEHVFGEFNQADGSIIRKYGGTGLGLSISKQLVEAQNGVLSLRSEVGQGTTFTVVLPFREVKSAEEATVAPAAPEEAEAPKPTLKGRQVLVVDDDPYSRTLCELMLKRWGMQAHLANDAKQAMQLLQQHTFDVVLTDIQLPGTSGKALARLIRKKNPVIPILALTANIMSRNKEFFAKTGISDYLLKPYSDRELHQKLSKALLPLPDLAAAPAPAAVAAPVLAVPAPQQPLFDLTEIRHFTGEDSAALAAILEVLVADNRQNLQLLLNEAGAGNWQQVGTVAHKMQTAFKHLRTHTITGALTELEQVLHQPKHNTAQCQEAVVLLQEQVPLVLAALEDALSAHHVGQTG
ncbi:ATP-binding protein [Pontibacter beigongshangensis]|uniref:ATP-binding protein n=1 Tax=Pontibacter beigongshangensis TaxID=2574733 RepID=UPI0016502524|nr:ATP-binding protein [Pontibacter beigongshangensis]